MTHSSGLIVILIDFLNHSLSNLLSTNFLQKLYLNASCKSSSERFKIKDWTKFLWIWLLPNSNMKEIIDLNTSLFNYYFYSEFQPYSIKFVIIFALKFREVLNKIDYSFYLLVNSNTIISVVFSLFYHYSFWPNNRIKMAV